MSTHLTHCAALVRDADRDRYLAALFAPAQHRDALTALYAFNVEIARVRDVAREPMPGEIRLQWWREVLAGERDGEAAAHPVAAALQEMRARYRIAADRLAAIIDAHAFDLYDEPMASLDNLDRYGAETDGAVFDLAAEILACPPLIPAKAGIQNGDSEDCDPGSPLARGRTGELSRHAGIAYAVAGILSDLGCHGARRRLYLPMEVLERHGVDRETIFAREITPGLQMALAELRGHARLQLAAARAELDHADPLILPALLPAAGVGPQLRRLARNDGDPFAPQRLPPWRRQWAIWRAARNPRRLFAA
jgi:phytoene synthase